MRSSDLESDPAEIIKYNDSAHHYRFESVVVGLL